MSMAIDRDGCKWEDICISNLGEIIAGGTPSRAVPSYWEGDIPWITPGEVIRMKGKNAKTNALKASVSRGNSADDVKSALGIAQSGHRARTLLARNDGKDRARQSADSECMHALTAIFRCQRGPQMHSE